LIEVCESDLRKAYENFVMAVRSGNREQIDTTKLMLDIVTSHINQKNHQINQNNP
jgi:hypothetical protein